DLGDAVGDAVLVGEDQAVRGDEGRRATFLESQRRVLQVLQPVRGRAELVLGLHLLQRQVVEGPHALVAARDAAEPDAQAQQKCRQEALIHLHPEPVTIFFFIARPGCRPSAPHPRARSWANSVSPPVHPWISGTSRSSTGYPPRRSRRATTYRADRRWARSRRSSR